MVERSSVAVHMHTWVPHGGGQHKGLGASGVKRCIVARTRGFVSVRT